MTKPLWQEASNPKKRSWVDSANAPHSDFPIQNLPFGVFSGRENTTPRLGTAIGDYVIDLSVLEKEGLLTCAPGVFARSTLNDFLACGRAVWREVRATLSSLLDAHEGRFRDDTKLCAKALLLQADTTMHMPVDVRGYTDFYSSIEHATNVGSMFRDPKNALLPNWLEMPIGYNGRASSVVVSGTQIRRPCGQVKAVGSDRPHFSESKKLDIELEMGFIVGSGNQLGEPILCEDAEAHIFGMVLLNDWSARDLQQWEYVPLGPFNSKGFATTISPWIVTLDAIEPFRCAQPAQDPLPLEYLRHGGNHGFDIDLEVQLRPHSDPQATTITRTNFKHMYWSMAQQLAHHTVSGCNTRVGDLMGSGTISGSSPDSFGSLLELTWNGERPLALRSGAVREFIEDGDELVIRGWCQGDGYRIGFGDCSGRVVAALVPAGNA